MRILMIIDGLPGGGAEKSVLTLGKGIVNLGHKVSIFSLRDICNYNIPNGIEYKIIQDKSRLPWRKLTELNRRAQNLDKEVIKSQQNSGTFDLVISNLHKTDRIVARSKAIPKDRVWFCLHTMFSNGYLNCRWGLSYWLKKKKIYRLYQNRNLISVSFAVLEDIQKSFNINPKKKRVIYNPFDFSEIRKLAKEPCEFTGKKYLIHVGRLEKNKRQDRLIRAYAKSGIQAPLLILGDGRKDFFYKLQDLANQLKVRDRVLFKKFDHNPYRYIYRAQLLILSSDSEGFGNVLVEAHICGTPVVSTKCPGGPAEILSGDFGVGLSELTSTSLAEKIYNVYNNPPKCDPSSLAFYDINTICQQYMTLV